MSTATASTNGAAFKAASVFLHGLFDHAPEDLFFYFFVLPGRTSYWFRCGAVDEAVSLLPRFGGANVYVGCALSRTDRGTHQRVTADTAAGTVGLWADIDVKGPAHKSDKLPPTIADATKVIAAFPLPPTVVVDSGHGLQPWWLFKEPLVISDAAERQQAMRRVERFQATLRRAAEANGWELDSTHDLARVLRVPGTTNAKPNRPPVPVRVLAGADFSRRYDPTDFEEHLVAAGAARLRVKAVSDGQKIGEGKRNATLTSYAGSLRRPGFTREAIEAALLVLNEQRCEPPLAEAEVKQIAASVSRCAPAQTSAESEGDTRAELSDGLALILADFRERYDPTFKRGVAIFSRALGVEVKPGEATYAPDRALLEKLALASDAPRDKNGVVKSQLPAFFWTYAKCAWKELIKDLKEESASEEIVETAADEFRRLVAICLLTQATFTEKGKPQRRTLLEWGRLWAKPGPWTGVRSALLWCKTEGGQLRLALRAELFDQFGPNELRKVAHRKFADLCVLYGVGEPGGEAERPGGRRAVILADNFLSDLPSCLPEGVAGARAHVGNTGNSATSEETNAR